MKRTALMTLVCLFLSGLGWATSAVEIPNDSFDFGFVPNNSKTSHTFWLKSVGKDTLKVLKVIPGCGCTQAPLDKKEIAPGDSAALEIIFSSGQRNGKTLKHPAVLTDDGTGRRMLTFNAEVTHEPLTIKPAVFQPYRLFVSRAGGVDITEADFTIENVSDKAISVKVVSSPNGYFKIDLPDKIDPGQKADCKLTIDKSFLENAFEKSVTFEFDDENHTRFSLPIIRRLIGAESAKK
ncbi:MAG: DUF1573 domain-containing protein [Candidatus Zixiibacteriota bacterium]